MAEPAPAVSATPSQAGPTRASSQIEGLGKFKLSQAAPKGSSYKARFQTLREKYEVVVARQDDLKKELELATKRLKSVQAENDLLLDAMQCAVHSQPTLVSILQQDEQQEQTFSDPKDIQGAYDSRNAYYPTHVPYETIGYHPPLSASNYGRGSGPGAPGHSAGVGLGLHIEHEEMNGAPGGRQPHHNVPQQQYPPQQQYQPQVHRSVSVNGNAHAQYHDREYDRREDVRIRDRERERVRDRDDEMRDVRALDEISVDRKYRDVPPGSNGR